MLWNYFYVLEQNVNISNILISCEYWAGDRTKNKVLFFRQLGFEYCNIPSCLIFIPYYKLLEYALKLIWNAKQINLLRRQLTLLKLNNLIYILTYDIPYINSIIYDIKPESNYLISLMPSINRLYHQRVQSVFRYLKFAPNFSICKWVLTSKV